MSRYSVRDDGITGYRAYVMIEADGRWWDYCETEGSGYLERAEKIAALLNAEAGAS